MPQLFSVVVQPQQNSKHNTVRTLYITIDQDVIDTLSAEKNRVCKPDIFLGAVPKQPGLASAACGSVDPNEASTRGAPYEEAPYAQL